MNASRRKSRSHNGPSDLIPAMVPMRGRPALRNRMYGSSRSSTVNQGSRSARIASYGR